MSYRHHAGIVVPTSDRAFPDRTRVVSYVQTPVSSLDLSPEWDGPFDFETKTIEAQRSASRYQLGGPMRPDDLINTVRSMVSSLAYHLRDARRVSDTRGPLVSSEEDALLLECVTWPAVPGVTTPPAPDTTI